MTDLFKDYEEYVNIQKSRAKKTAGTTRSHPQRREYIYSKMCEYKVAGNSILCVGARDKSETEFFKLLGFLNVVGIDLYESPGILFCDMSKMHLDPVLSKQVFDIIISIESLEHCLDVEGFLKGLNLLCSNYFICMCPVITVTSKWDCSSWPFMIDLKDSNDLKEKLEKYFNEFNVICSEIHKKGSRIFFILKKKEVSY